MSLTDDLKQTSINLMSVHSNVRAKGMKGLLAQIKRKVELPPKITYALFYYFWYSDGYVN